MDRRIGTVASSSEAASASARVTANWATRWRSPFARSMAYRRARDTRWPSISALSR